MRARFVCQQLRQERATGHPGRHQEDREVEPLFSEVSGRANLPEMEERILAWWRENNTFQGSIRAGAKPWVFYEGPPTANGLPGTHHVLARVFKDVFPRYQTMKGHYVLRKGGWDTHGLPVELEVEKQLGFSGKRQIEAYGVAEFNARCRESVFRYVRQWEEMTERVGVWMLTTPTPRSRTSTSRPCGGSSSR
jgi:isoleucyl-tRNA synthetase